MAIFHDRFALERRYPHGRDRLFAVVSDPALKQRWHAGPLVDVRSFEMDFRVGGAERQSYALGPDTPFPGTLLENEGRFEDIVAGERVVLTTTMTFGGKRISTALLTFELADADDGGSTLTFTHQAVFYEGADGPEMRRAGWESMLDSLNRSLAEAQPA
jgi:uncharacterized protein YndB with AHSA1/START domain